MSRFISVIIPTHNRETTIRGNLGCVRGGGSDTLLYLINKGLANSKMPEIDHSVVIPTSYGCRTLEKCLASMETNETKYKCEIIVADVESSDNTVDV